MLVNNLVTGLSPGIVQLGSKLNPNAGAYGVRIDEANISPDLERIGKAELHALLPVHNSMKPCLLLDSGVVNYYLNPTDWTKKMDGTPSVRDGSDGQVMIEVPTYYRNVVNSAAGVYDHYVSLFPIPGWQKVNKFYVGAYEGAVNRTELKLSSVINTTATYRGGNNNAAWDAQLNSLLGKPATLLPLENGTVMNYI